MQAYIGEIIVTLLLLGIGIWLKSLGANIHDLQQDHKAMAPRLATFEAEMEEVARRLSILEQKIDRLSDAISAFNAFLSSITERGQSGRK